MKTQSRALIWTWYTLLALSIAHNAHAFYNPGQGRWLNRDPSGDIGGRNRYCLVGNAPAGIYDKLGLLPGSGPCSPVELRDVTTLGSGVHAKTDWIFTPNPPEFVSAWCGCTDQSKWTSIHFSCVIQIRYAHGHEPDETLSWLHPVKTLRDHEMGHAVSLDNLAGDLKTLMQSYLNICMTADCRTARLNALSKYHIYIAAEAEAEGASLDCADYEPGPSQVVACRDAVSQQINALAAYFEWSSARSDANRVCNFISP